MAGLRGPSLNCAACWGWRCDGRAASPGAAPLVRHAEPLVSEGSEVKSARTAEADTSAREQGHSKSSATFLGTSNPRHLRAIAALLRRPMPRESLDKEAGASNAPELIAELRRRGLDAPCERIRFIDRDGRPCSPGVYAFTARDRRRLYAWIAERGRRGRNG